MQWRVELFAFGCALLCGTAGNLPAQGLRLPNAGVNMPSTTEEKPDKKNAGKPMISVNELGTLDVKFHNEMDAADANVEGQKFADADHGLTQLISEIDDLLQRIQTTPIQKGSFQVDGVSKPTTPENETAYFKSIKDKAVSRKAVESILAPISDQEKHATDLLISGKNLEARDGFHKASTELAANKTRIPEAAYQEYLARSISGQQAAVTSYWSAEFDRLKKTYNASTDPGLSPEQVHATVKAVADEIAQKGYLDPAKTPDMPADARALFKNLLDTANQYLHQ